MLEVCIKKYFEERFGEERALYGSKDIIVEKCKFQGEEDGESALKECENIEILDTYFDLRYPLWHVANTNIKNSKMTQNCRAALWYDEDVVISDSKLYGIKALRECEKVKIENSNIHSKEFGWFCEEVQMNDCTLKGEYPFMKSEELKFDNFELKGKYSFQYTEDVVIKNSYLDTKDAFWHAENVLVENSIVKGEYLAWYSENVTFRNCKIIGTQPFCYCKNLVLENCEMIDCDLSFEKSEVNATVIGEITSVKNPKTGRIEADAIGSIILDETAIDSTCEIITK